ncbi:hypothetical protein CCL12_07095 [Pseudomonas syringae]|nr:hypothetical protein CCL12_07095 [Pseudomonas syringae]
MCIGHFFFGSFAYRRLWFAFRGYLIKYFWFKLFKACPLLCVERGQKKLGGYALLSFPAMIF